MVEYEIIWFDLSYIERSYETLTNKTWVTKIRSENVLCRGIVLFFDNTRSEESWCLESSFTNYLFTVSDNLSWKYKYITDLQIYNRSPL